MLLFDDSATVTALWIGAGSAAFTALVLALVAVVLVQARRPVDAQFADMLREVSAHLSASLRHAEERTVHPGPALAGAQEETPHARRLALLGTTLDLDELLSQVLEAAAALPGVDAAMVELSQGDAAPVVATLGLSAEEAARQPVIGSRAGPSARALAVGFRYAPAEVAVRTDLIAGGLLVPLPGEADQQIGTLGVFWRGREREPSDEQLAALERLAARAAPAIENARRFQAARELADLDALTSLHNRRFFHETLAREVKRAERYDRRLALIVFDIDDFKAINDRLGHLAGDAVLAEFGERVRSVVRSADIACRVGGDEFAVILPESTPSDAEQLYRRLQLAVAERPTGVAERLELSAGIAELRRGDDGLALFERADEALYRAKGTGKKQVIAGENAG